MAPCGPGPTRRLSCDPPITTAVVLIEYQNDFATEGGGLHDAVRPVMEKTDMLANTARIVEAARAAGAHRHACTDHLR